MVADAEVEVGSDWAAVVVSSSSPHPAERAIVAVARAATPTRHRVGTGLFKVFRSSELRVQQDVGHPDFGTPN
jgi:hypothetical protein